MIYGIKNHDTMEKARAWLDGHGVDFHDYKAAGIARGTLDGWARASGMEDARQPIQNSGQRQTRASPG